MARSEARFQFTIWRGLEGTNANARLLYAVLLTDPTVNHAGVGPIRLTKWARNASLTAEEALKALTELSDGDFVIFDEDTDEVLVRTMIRNDGVADQPFVLKGAIKEALRTESSVLRRALAAELRKLPPRKPDSVSRGGKPVTYPDPHAAADELESTCPAADAKGLGNTFETLSEEPETLSDAPVSKPTRKGLETLHGRGRGRGSTLTTEQLDLEQTTSANVEQDRFGEFWTAYPRKVKRLAAEKAWRSALTRRVDPEHLIEKATAYAKSVAGKEINYVLHPASWLNAGAYDDEPESPSRRGSHQSYQDPDPDEYSKPMWEEQHD